MTASFHFGPRHGSWQGAFALARFATQTGSRRRAFRSALWSGTFIALFSIPLIALVARTSAVDATDILALRVLAYASWLVGIFGCWAFLAPESASPKSALLARQRGFSGETVGQLWAVGTALRMSVAVFLITLPPLLFSIALSATPEMLTSRLLLLPGVAAYAVILGGTLAWLAQLARRLTPHFPRLTVAALVLLPFAASLWFPAIPSLPGVFGWLLDGLIALGGWLL